MELWSYGEVGEKMVAIGSLVEQWQVNTQAAAFVVVCCAVIMLAVGWRNPRRRTLGALLIAAAGILALAPLAEADIVLAQIGVTAAVGVTPILFAFYCAQTLAHPARRWQTSVTGPLTRWNAQTHLPTISQPLRVTLLLPLALAWVSLALELT